MALDYVMTCGKAPQSPAVEGTCPGHTAAVSRLAGGMRGYKRLRYTTKVCKRVEGLRGLSIRLPEGLGAQC